MAWWKQWVLGTFGTFGSQGHEPTPGYPRALCDTFKAQGPEEFLALSATSPLALFGEKIYINLRKTNRAGRNYPGL